MLFKIKYQLEYILVGDLMSLIEKHIDGLSIIEIYDDYQLKDQELEDTLKEVYDLCNVIAMSSNNKIKDYFYTKKELDKLNE
jgi:hypothetical protein